VAGSGAGSSLSIVPTVLNKILGMKFKIVEGYQGTNAALIALERGEIDGLCHTYSLFQTTDARLIKDGTLRVLMHVEETPLADDPGVPSVFDFVKDERQKQLLRFVFSSVEFGRPYAAPPGVPKDRLAALQQAFADTLHDPTLIDDAKKAGLDMTYRSPKELENLVRALYETPPEVIAEVEKIVPGSGLR
jgi:tripartite-type tricarboxylate transporter receptor subunit TctC